MIVGQFLALAAVEPLDVRVLPHARQRLLQRFRKRWGSEEWRAALSSGMKKATLQDETIFVPLSTRIMAVCRVQDGSPPALVVVTALGRRGSLELAQ